MLVPICIAPCCSLSLCVCVCEVYHWERPGGGETRFVESPNLKHVLYYSPPFWHLYDPFFFHLSENPYD